MLAPAASFSDFVLAVHILGAIVGFGVTFAYPVFFAAAMKADPAIVPWLWTTVRRVERYLVNPGLLLVVVAGVILASDEHYWGSFFVQWGIGAAIVIGAVVGSYMIPREGRLAELAARDLAAAPAGGGASWSEEYLALSRQWGMVGALLDLLVVVTVFLMATHA